MEQCEAITPRSGKEITTPVRQATDDEDQAAHAEGVYIRKMKY